MVASRCAADSQTYGAKRVLVWQEFHSVHDTDRIT